MPVVRVNAHVQRLTEKQNMQELASKVQRIVDNNRGQIIQYCAARRQEYLLNTSRVEKKTYQFEQLTLTHKIYFEQEIIEIDVYPDAGIPEEKDPLCLMIVFNDTVWAIPMEQLANPQAIGVVYTKKLIYTALGEENMPYRQYKFVGAQIGFLVSPVEFPDPRLVGTYLMQALGGMYLTPISKKLELSKSVNTGIFGVLNGDGQKVYMGNADYEYTEDAVDVVNTVDLDGGTPYAIDSSGVRYFGGFAGETYPVDKVFGNLWAVQSGVDVYIYHAGAMYPDGGYTNTMYEEYVNQYVALSGGSFQRPGVQLGAGYGTIPGNTLNISFSYAPRPLYTPIPVSPDVPFRYDYELRSDPIPAVDMAIPHPVFSTGKKEGEDEAGDRIELVPIQYNSTSKVDWFFYAKNYSPPNPPVYPEGSNGGDEGRDTTVTVSFGPISYSATDYARIPSTWIFEPGNSNSPGLVVRVYTDFPAPGGIMYETSRYSSRHRSPVLEEDVDTDSFSSSAIYPAGYTLSSGDNGVSFEPIGHVSNGKDYIQAFYAYPAESIESQETKVFCNGVDIFPQLEAQGITKWNIMVMDVPLSRIKKFT